MGIFDPALKKDIKAKDILHKVEQGLKPSCELINLEDNKLTCTDYKPKGSVLKYDLEVFINKKDVQMQGELKGVLFLVILIVFGILFTYGLAVILVIGYVYWQKMVAQKEFEKLLENLSME